MAAVESELIGPQWGLHLREVVMDGRPVVYISGGIHSFNAHLLSELLLAYGRHEHLTIDLSGVHRFGPAAFHALVAGARQLADAGCTLVLQNPSRTVKAVLGNDGAQGQFEITETITGSPRSD